MFDPYHKWLGIPKDQRPPTHYQLLGIAADEQDADVIEEATIRQTTHVRAYQMGPHAADCTRVLNEIAQAKRTLLDPARRQQYDESLPKTPAAKQPAPEEALTAKPPPVKAARETLQDPEDADLPAQKRSGEKRRHRQREKKSGLPLPLVIGGGAAVGVVVLGLVIFLATRGDGRAVEKKNEKDLAQGLPKDKEKKVRADKNNDKNKDKTEQKKSPGPEEKKKPIKEPDENEEPGGGEVGTSEWQVGRSTVLAVATREPNLVLLGDGEFKLFDLDKRKTVRKFEKERASGGGTVRASAAVTPDGGRFFGTLMDDPTIYCWDLKTGKLLGQLAGHTLEWVKVALTPNGKFLVSIGEDKTVRLWDTTTFQELSLLGTHESRVADLNISSDGRRAVTGGSNTLKVWDLEKRQLLGAETGKAIFSVAFSPDGKQLVTSGQYGHLTVRDAESLQVVKTIETNKFSGKILFTPDSKYLFAKGKEGTIFLLQWPSLQQLYKLEAHAKKVSHLTLTGDGGFLFTCGMGLDPNTFLRKWSVTNMARAYGRPSEEKIEAAEGVVRRLKDHKAAVTSLALFPDGKTLISGSIDGVLRTWNLEDGKSTMTTTFPGKRIRTLALSPDLQHLAVGTEVVTLVVNPMNHAEIAKPFAGLKGAFWVGPGLLIHIQEPKYFLLDLGKKTRGVGDLKFPAVAMFASPSGRVLLTVTTNHVHLYRVSPHGVLKLLAQFPTQATCAAFSPDDKTVAYADQNNTIHRVNLETKQASPILIGHEGKIHCLVFCPGGNRLLSGSADKTMRLWDLKESREVRQFTRHDGPVQAIVCTPDGRHAFTGAGDTIIRQWALPPEGK